MGIDRNVSLLIIFLRVVWLPYNTTCNGIVRKVGPLSCERHMDINERRKPNNTWQLLVRPWLPEAEAGSKRALAGVECRLHCSVH